jgi:hypothetical protein
MIDIIECNCFLAITELNKSKCLTLLTTIGKVNEMPICKILLVLNVLINVCVTITIQISISISCQSIYTTFTRTNPGSKISVTKNLIVLISLLIINCHSESKMPRLLLYLIPLEPTSNTILFREGE